MWIRTQNKMCVCNIENMEGISIGKRLGDNGFFITMRFSSERADNCELGEYQTEQRAIEVLDEICNAYLDLNIEKGGEFFGMNSSTGYFGGYVKNEVYKMLEV